LTAPTLSQLRVLDAFNPRDPAIRAVASGGVTTSLVLPGSALLMGGEGFVFKLRPAPDGTSEGMLVNHGLEEGTGWRWMKMACGENPKAVFSSQKTMPMTRMGEAWMFRERLSKARDLLRQQDAWCAAAERIQNHPDRILSESFPESLENESLVALLRGKVKLNVHCYEVCHDPCIRSTMTDSLVDP
jgi:imidazolonepropionase-like amidohydrolase